MLAQAHVADLIADVVVVVDEAVEEHRPRGLGRAVPPCVIDVVERTAFVHQFEVIPVLATDKGAAVAVLQLQVMHALEDLREGFTLLEVQAVVVSRAGGGSAPLAKDIGAGNEVRVRAAHCPAGTYRKR
ncbi:hypothetical protein D3C76_1228550 [compost metagenome]